MEIRGVMTGSAPRYADFRHKVCTIIVRVEQQVSSEQVTPVSRLLQLHELFDNRVIRVSSDSLSVGVGEGARLSIRIGQKP